MYLEAARQTAAMPFVADVPPRRPGVNWLKRLRTLFTR
jgi:hypothetical protein